MTRGLREFERLSGKASQGYHLTQQAHCRQQLKLQRQHCSLLIHQGFPRCPDLQFAIFVHTPPGSFHALHHYRMWMTLTQKAWQKRTQWVQSPPPQEAHGIRFPMGKRGWDISPQIFINLIIVWFWLVQIHNLARSKHNKEHQYLWEKDITWIQNVSGHRLAWHGSREDQGELPGVRRVGFHLFKITWPDSLLHVQPAAAAAKSLQSCPTPGSPVPGILQPRTLAWVAMSFCNAWKRSHSIVSDPQQPHGLQPSRLLCPWDFPGKRHME